MIIPIAIRKLKRIKIGLPPAHLFDEMLGYSKNRRFFAFFWLRGARVPILSDGGPEIVGAVEPYRIWRYHPQVLTALNGFNCGDSAEVAEHWLLVDRKTRALYAGKAADVQAVLDYQQRGVVPPMPDNITIVKSGSTRQVHSADRLIAAKSFRRQPTVGIRQIHELEEWLAENL